MGITNSHEADGDELDLDVLESVTGGTSTMRCTRCGGTIYMSPEHIHRCGSIG